jgi:hypothetical protein
MNSATIYIYAQYAPIIKEDNEVGDTTVQGVQYYLNN